MSLKKILSNTFAQIFSKACLAILGLLSVKILTNYLSEESYGNYIYVYEFLAFFGIISDLGIFTIAVKEISENEKDTEKILGNILSLRALLVVLATFFAVLLAFLTSTQNEVIFGVFIASLTMIVATLNGTIQAVLQAKLKMEKASLALVVGKVFSVGFMGYIALYGLPENSDLGFYYLFVGGLIGIVLTYFYTAKEVKKICKISYRFDKDLWLNILKESLPYGIALLLNTIYFRIDSILIFHLRSSEELGIYGIAMKTLEQFVLIPLFFMNSVLPSLSKSIQEKKGRHKKIIKSSFDFLFALSLPLVIGGFLLAKEIISLISTEKYLTNLSQNFYGSDLAFQILIFALLFQFLSVLFSFILISKNFQKKLLFINGSCALLNLILNFIFIPSYGFVGAAITSVFCELFILAATYLVAKKSLNFQLDFYNFFKIMLSGVIMGAFLLISKGPLTSWLGLKSLIPLISGGAGIYAFAILALKVPDKDLLQRILPSKK